MVFPAKLLVTFTAGIGLSFSGVGRLVSLQVVHPVKLLPAYIVVIGLLHGLVTGMGRLVSLPVVWSTKLLPTNTAGIRLALVVG